MAKEDFCFTYYDGDAARDTTHMNRLERGAYHDIVISQRKFGHLTGAQVTKILGRDFDECWPAIELIMIKDADGKFFIEWLDRSILKMQAHSKKQSENRKGKTKINQTGTKQEPTLNQTQPLEDGDGNGNEDGIELENKKESHENDPRETDSETLGDVEFWTSQVLDGNDAYFLNMVRNASIILNGQLENLARDHLGKCARYNWHERMTTQQAFRHSLLNYITENLKTAKDKQNGKPSVTLAELQALRKGDV